MYLDEIDERGGVVLVVEVLMELEACEVEMVDIFFDYFSFDLLKNGIVVNTLYFVIINLLYLLPDSVC